MAPLSKLLLMIFVTWTSANKNVTNVPIAKIIDSAGPHYQNDIPENVIDGNHITYWNIISGRYFNNWYITFELAERYTVLTVNLLNYGDNTHDTTRFKLEASDDKATWHLVGNVSGVATGSNVWQRFDGFTATGNYLRFTITETKSGWQPWLCEISFFGYPAECSVGCGPGTCVGPNKCKCPKGYTGPNCIKSENDNQLTLIIACSTTALFVMVIAAIYTGLYFCCCRKKGPSKTEELSDDAAGQYQPQKQDKLSGSKELGKTGELYVDVSGQKQPQGLHTSKGLTGGPLHHSNHQSQVQQYDGGNIYEENWPRYKDDGAMYETLNPGQNYQDPPHAQQYCDGSMNEEINTGKNYQDSPQAQQYNDKHMYENLNSGQTFQISPQDQHKIYDDFDEPMYVQEDIGQNYQDLPQTQQYYDETMHENYQDSQV